MPAQWREGGRPGPATGAQRRRWREDQPQAPRWHARAGGPREQ